MAFVYIIYSKSIDKYYVGSCLDLTDRLGKHLSGEVKKAYTNKAKDWKIFFHMPELEYKQARSIEAHIKRMKSRKYMENLKLYPEISNKHKETYAGSSR